MSLTPSRHPWRGCFPEGVRAPGVVVQWGGYLTIQALEKGLGQVIADEQYRLAGQVALKDDGEVGAVAEEVFVVVLSEDERLRSVQGAA